MHPSFGETRDTHGVYGSAAKNVTEFDVFRFFPGSVLERRTLSSAIHNNSVRKSLIMEYFLRERIEPKPRRGLRKYSRACSRNISECRADSSLTQAMP